jgi:hypothetical protein
MLGRCAVAILCRANLTVATEAWIDERGATPEEQIGASFQSTVRIKQAPAAAWGRSRTNASSMATEGLSRHGDR